MYTLVKSGFLLFVYYLYSFYFFCNFLNYFIFFIYIIKISIKIYNKIKYQYGSMNFKFKKKFNIKGNEPSKEFMLSNINTFKKQTEFACVLACIKPSSVPQTFNPKQINIKSYQ